MAEQVDDGHVQLTVGQGVPVEEVSTGGRRRVRRDVGDRDVAAVDGGRLGRDRALKVFDHHALGGLGLDQLGELLAQLFVLLVGGDVTGDDHVRAASRSMSCAVPTEHDSRRWLPSGRVMTTSPGIAVAPAQEVRSIDTSDAVRGLSARQGVDVAEHLGGREAGDLLAAGVPRQDRAIVGEGEDAVRRRADDLVELAALLDDALEQPASGDRVRGLAGQRLQHGEVVLGVALETGAVEHRERAEAPVLVDEWRADGVTPADATQQVGHDVGVVGGELAGASWSASRAAQRMLSADSVRTGTAPVPSYW